MKAFITLLVFVLFLASAGHSTAATKLSQVFQFDMLNAQVAYLEHIVGPALHVNPDGRGGQIRDYRVGGCDVQAIVTGSGQNPPSVTAYSLALTPNCNFNFSAFRLSDLYTRGLTVSRIPDFNFLDFESDCIDMCGNAADPTVDFILNSSHATNWIGAVFTVVLAEDAAINAAEKLRELMEGREGGDYVINTKFNCDQKYANAAAQIFANVPINKVTVGIFPGDPGGRCQ